ncbi:PapD-like protein [Catenaria anguillulae PL171]|uniref:PapD-like protein n=1 Tax=Catenaria anguillulae PL171 TaxID=765915 RepID=A0A1Y2HZ54_9FUNG|nr:PapD-like protein [Catenaria anguillulae PL171]
MSIELDPSQQLSFPRPLADGSSVTLKLRNPGDVTVAFKVKTTAPKQYCVRPNCGNIGPRETVDISVLLQPMKIEPPAGFKCKDKFLVQSVAVAPLEVDLQSTELWLAVEKARKEEIVEHKLRCAYLDPTPTAGENGTPGVAAPNNTLEAHPPSDPTHVPLPGGDSPQMRNIHSVAESIYSAAPSAASASTTPVVTSNNGAPNTTPSMLAPTPEDPYSNASSSSNLVKSPSSVPAPAPTTAAAAAVAQAQAPLSTLSHPTRARPPPSPRRHFLRNPPPLPRSPRHRICLARRSLHQTCPTLVLLFGLATASTAALEAKIAQLQAALTDRDRQIAQLQVEATQLRQRSASAAKVAPQDVKPQVITRTVVNPSYYSPQLVVIIALVAFWWA